MILTAKTKHSYNQEQHRNLNNQIRKQLTSQLMKLKPSSRPRFWPGNGLDIWENKS